MIDIIISYYNSREFENFLEYVIDNIDCDYKVIIYNKSNDVNYNSNSNSNSNSNYNIIKLSNIGREGETYLNHIIQNYDNLNEYTLFIQDDTDNHIINHVTFLNKVKEIINQNQKFKMFETSWRKGDSSIKRTIIDGCFNLCTLPSNDSMKVACELHGIILPKIYTTETCAFFICHKDIILKNPKEFYIKLRSWLLENGGNGFTLEHIWELIFADN